MSEPRTFPAFPHEPYSIQLDFMRALYDTVDAGGIGLFESPTGALLSTQVTTAVHVLGQCLQLTPFRVGRAQRAAQGSKVHGH